MGREEDYGHSPHDMTTQDHARNDRETLKARDTLREVFSWVTGTIGAHGAEVAKVCLAGQIHHAFLEACKTEVPAGHDTVRIPDPDGALAWLAYCVAVQLIDAHPAADAPPSAESLEALFMEDGS
jgi:hypothetical protein